MTEDYSLRKTAEIVEISLDTAFMWRHKILNAIRFNGRYYFFNGRYVGYILKIL